MKTYSYTAYDLTDRSKHVKSIEVPNELEARRLINFWNRQSTLSGEKNIRWLYVLD
jgi:hypothetical protein